MDQYNTKESKIKFLRKLRIGDLNAEDDNYLPEYFYETLDFLEVVSGRKSIITGPKGSGKSAIIQILKKKQGHYPEIPEIADKILIFIDDPNEVRELNKFTEAVRSFGKIPDTSDSHNELTHLWEIYIASKIGERFISNNTKYNIDTSKLENYLSKLKLYTGDKHDPGIVRNLPKYIKSLGIQLPEGPKGTVEFRAPHENIEEKEENLRVLLRLIDDVLKDINFTRGEKGKGIIEVWVLFDRVDEIYPWPGSGNRDNQRQILGTLMTAYSDFRIHEYIKLKIFIRDDIYDELPFVNKDHFSDKVLKIEWDDTHLIMLLSKRIQFFLNNGGNGISEQSAVELFEWLFGKNYENPDGSQVSTRDYIFSRLQDGHGNISPRDLLNFVGKAKDSQIDLYNRKRDNQGSIIGREAVDFGLKDASSSKLNDYLYNIFRDIREKVEYFRGEEKVKFSRKDLIEILELENEDKVLDEALKQLLDAGFLQKVGKKSIKRTKFFKVAPIYRNALDILDPGFGIRGSGFGTEARGESPRL
ncbi:MAG: hypothetical protein K8T10_09895 [Candidatus Eremiobacteraeota bacterium]|nr:hypothetical protein [Candidatus Eremiobacteraeota bacterium]